MASAKEERLSEWIGRSKGERRLDEGMVGKAEGGGEERWRP